MTNAVLATPIRCVPRERVGGLNEAAFAGFYRRTERGLWAYVYRITSDAADADDIVQEAFLRLLRATIDGDEEQWRRYLYRVASNLVVDRWRVRKKTERAGETPQVSSVSPPDAAHQDVARTFAELMPRDRALLWLAYVEGETHEEMAASLGVRRGSIKVLLFRARRRLRDLLNAKGMGARTS